MSGPRARSAVPADHRSAHPDFPGVPWWGAVLLAITFTAIGFAYDAGSGNRELGSVFAVCFGFGCVLAVLAVRQSGVFTAVIQPPLLLFFAVPGAYFLFHSSEIHGLKDLAINCGYPLIERFPLMFFTSALVLLLGAARWYLGRSAHAAAAAPATEKPRKAGPGLLTALSAAFTAATAKRAPSTDEDDDGTEQPRRRRAAAADRPRRARPAAERTRADRDRSAARKPTKRTGTPSRSRHARPADTEIIEPVVDRPRRPRPARSADDAPPPRRRSRDQRERETRRTRDGQPRERRSRERPSREDLPPLDRRSTYERPERRRRYRDYDDFDPLSSNGTNGSGSSSHHPVSRVRYRGGDEDGAERTEYPSRSRSRRSWDPDNWEYDV
ncbi:exosortase/archaeosortase family protein [Mycolicibacterium sp. F2034L]|uniref:exosortase/archaeosortase family protein n=1 Tax=Mycolicibacterium sp. F2034L TaxID=2926422 RepID=UPI001FF4A4EA|nr:exosortase/archaeosortase family protein [Mycolicibacterium sp. F2034L]MCK0173003.1 exosortase/archaeosortase family protein [Mycolicibacterium sp. F2034L]